MPHRMWKHKCPSTEGGGEIGRGVEVCSDCGQSGKYDGWYLSVVEHWCQFRRLTGFSPFDPRASLAHRLLAPLTRICQECKGRGVVERDVEPGQGWRICSACDWLGASLVGTTEEIEDVRKRVLELEPDGDVLALLFKVEEK